MDKDERPVKVGLEVDEDGARNLDKIWRGRQNGLRLIAAILVVLILLQVAIQYYIGLRK